MKIAIISSGFLPVVDGVTVTGLYRLQKLSDWGHQILLFCPDYSEIEHIYPNWREYTGEIMPGVEVVNLASTPFLDIDFERNVSRKSYQTLLYELKKFQPDLVHVDEPERLFTGFLRVAGVDFAKRYDLPCVTFFRTNFLDYLDDYFPLHPVAMTGVKFGFKKFLARVYNSYDVTMTQSIVTKEKTIEIGIKNSIFANLTGVNTEVFNPELRQENFFANNYQNPKLDRQIKLIFIGRLTPDKGWNFTIKAFAEVARAMDLKNVALLIAGDGQMREEIATELSQFTPNVCMLGRVAPEEMPALLANSDIHVTTSEKETKGLTVLEAFAVGIPVLAPNAGGVITSIENGENGFLFEPQNIQDFTQKLQQLVEDSALREAMGIKARNYVVENSSYENTAKNMVKIWQEQIELKNNSISRK
ncbi:MAG: glycosyltransferase [Prochloraceae cyanobacterium]|nr:glycosyltransferase [Prochloraceae cyanobacterium]